MRRKPDRALYDAETVHSILDEALYCHVGLVRDGTPVVIPTIHARDGERLYLHGSPAAGMFRDSRHGIEILRDGHDRRRGRAGAARPATTR